MSEHTTDTRATRLERSRSDRMLAGVAGGLAAYFELHPAVFRVAFVVLTLMGGAGIPINGFVQESVPSIVPVTPVPNTVSVSLKARDRDTGQAQISANRYKVQAGFSSTNPAVTNLSIDFQFDPGVNANTNYVLRQSIDFDPAVGATE